MAYELATPPPHSASTGSLGKQAGCSPRPWVMIKPSIVGEIYGEAVGKTVYRGVGAQHQRGERVNVDGDKLGVRKRPRGGDQKSS